MPTPSRASTGVRGIYEHKDRPGRYGAYVLKSEGRGHIRGQYEFLGTFRTIEEGIAARERRLAYYRALPHLASSG
jgi:hypothetical protein